MLFAGGNVDAFWARFTNAGDFGFSSTYSSGNSERVHGIALDQASNIFLSGRFTNALQVGPVGLSHNGPVAAFLAGLNTDTTFRWARAFTSPTSPVYPGPVALDAAGNVYTIGEYVGAADFGNGLEPHVNGSDAYLLKLPNGGPPPADP